MKKEMPHVAASLQKFARLVKKGRQSPVKGELHIGVDLGTSNIVIAIVDHKGNPVAGAIQSSSVVRDGIVVDYINAVQILKKLKCQLETQTGQMLYKAAVAIPPGISEGNIKVISNVVEAAGFEVSHIVDEPTAAACLLEIKNGAVVDIGGGTTGISVIHDGEVIFSADEPTGGTHTSLVLAGALHVSVEEAEDIKKNSKQHAEIFPIVTPVLEKMATIAAQWLKNYHVSDVYLVGGSSSLEQSEQVFQKILGKNIIKPVEPLLVTPLGLAIYPLRAKVE